MGLRKSRSLLACVAICGIVLPGLAGFAAELALFVSKQVTPASEYTSGIEGPAVDAAGNLYVVNFGKNGTIGRLRPGTQKSELFTKLPDGSIGNGIRFSRDGRMYVADYKRHNVLVLEHGETVPQIFFHSSQFNQPNDLAIAADGTLYASDPRFSQNAGQIWRITRGADGKGKGIVMSSERKMGTTNGIDLSPDGQTLYVSESQSSEIWAYRLDNNRLTQPRLVKKFAKPELDGLRVDIDGKIFVTRPGNGTVAVLQPDGTLLREVKLTGEEPTNLTFGGPDGQTVFVTQKSGRYIESFRVDRPGREPCLQGANMACSCSAQ